MRACRLEAHKLGKIGVGNMMLCKAMLAISLFAAAEIPESLPHEEQIESEQPGVAGQPAVTADHDAEPSTPAWCGGLLPITPEIWGYLGGEYGGDSWTIDQGSTLAGSSTGKWSAMRLTDMERPFRPSSVEGKNDP